MTRILRNGLELILLANALTTIGAAMAKDACSLLTKDELSDLIGTKITWAGPAGGKVPDGATACSYTAGQAAGVPGALLEASEAQGDALMTNCRGVPPLDELGDRACLRSTPQATMLTVTKGKAGVMITLFNTKAADPKSPVKKIAQTVLSRL